MSGYRQVERSEFIHKEDKCPSNSDEDTWECAAYKGGNPKNREKPVAVCTGHRNLRVKHKISFAKYKCKRGAIATAEQINTLRDRLKTELADRRKHIRYKYSTYLDGKNVSQGKTILASQELDIINSIYNLNHFVFPADLNDQENGLNWKISSKQYEALTASVGSVISADMIKQLEQYTLSAYRDCICYADCTQHGLSTWYEQQYCGCYCACNCT